jgi:hypothetical protein
MAFTSYADLKDTIALYLARSDLEAITPTFIQLAETRLRRELRLRQMLKVSTTVAVAEDSTIELPIDFLQMRDLHFNTDPIQVLKYDAPNVFYRNNFTTITGRPTNYTVLALEFQMSPIPDADYELQMLYYASPPFLSDTNTSNTFLNVCPDLLLYGALAEATPYLMDDARLATWASLYDRSKEALLVSDDNGEYAGSPMAITVIKR